VRIGGHRVGIGDRGSLIIGETFRSGVVLDVLEALDVQSIEAQQHRPEVDAPRAADGARSP